MLEEYDIAIIHRPGSQHGNADAMSRRPCDQCSIQDDEDAGNLYAAHVLFTHLQEEWWNLCQNVQFHIEKKRFLEKMYQTDVNKEPPSILALTQAAHK